MLLDTRRYVVIGASTNPLRISYQTVKILTGKNFDVIPIGIRDGKINGCTIQTVLPKIENIDTMILYINPDKQRDYYQYVIDCNPKNVIFNPGTENEEFADILEKNGINTVFDCAINLLNAGIL